MGGSRPAQGFRARRSAASTHPHAVSSPRAGSTPARSACGSAGSDPGADDHRDPGRALAVRPAPAVGRATSCSCWSSRSASAWILELLQRRRRNSRRSRETEDDLLYSDARSRSRRRRTHGARSLPADESPTLDARRPTTEAATEVAAASAPPKGSRLNADRRPRSRTTAGRLDDVRERRDRLVVAAGLQSAVGVDPHLTQRQSRRPRARGASSTSATDGTRGEWMS